MQLVIVGGGFAGLKLASSFENKDGWDILLIDRFNYHQFQPLFYQVATAGLDASNISFPLRKAFHGVHNIRIRIAEVIEIQSEKKIIVTSIGDFHYDFLVVATGADSNFFGNHNFEQYTWPMKSTVEALKIRHHLIQSLEKVLDENDMDKQKELLTIVIVGGGPTGVELAGAIAEMKKWVLPKDYPDIDFYQMQIHLIEGTDKLLANMSEASSKEANGYLQALGVNVLTGAMVDDYDGHTLRFKDGKNIQTRTVIWAAGIKGNVPYGISAESLTKGNRILVNAYNQIIGSKDIFALGDVCQMITEKFPKGLPQVAPVAIQQAQQLFKNIQRMKEGKNMLPFQYVDKGAMATIGRHKAVADLLKPKLHFRGFPAWIAWLILHLFQIVGVKNRFFVLWNWIYLYFTFDQSLRLLFYEFSSPGDVFREIGSSENKHPSVKKNRDVS